MGPGPFPDTVPDQLGDYRILREIGRGGMGIVYEAEQGSLGRRVALKVLPRQALTNPVQVRRFEREARAAGRLHHTNIVPVFGVGREGDHSLLRDAVHPGPAAERGAGRVAVAPPGRRIGREAGSAKAGSGPDAADPTAPPTAAEVARSLWTAPSPRPLPATRARPTPARRPTRNPWAVARLRRRRPGDRRGRTPTPWSARPRRRTRAGVMPRRWPGWASRRPRRSTTPRSRGVLHRDVKPSNLLLDVRGTLWVTDFGLAKLSDSEDLTHTGDILGTLRYMAPERFRGQSDVRSDVYGLGLTLYELLALRPAFEEADRSRLIDTGHAGGACPTC